MPSASRQSGQVRQSDSDPVVYISAAQADQAWARRIGLHLEAVTGRVGYADLAPKEQDDYDILAAVRESSRLFILLVSLKYLDSKEIYRTEFPHIRSLVIEKGRKIIYVILERCPWQHQILLAMPKVEIVPNDDRVLSEGDEEQIKDDLHFLARKVREAVQGIAETATLPPQGAKSEEAYSQTEPDKRRVQVLEDLITQTEIFLQYSMQAKALERLQKIAEVFPGEEEKNERLRRLYATANWRPEGKTGASPTPEARAQSDDWITQETFNRFSADAVEVLSRARRMRGEGGMIHTGQLLRAFLEHAAHGDGDKALVEFLRANDKNIIQVTSDSPLSRDVGPLLDRPTKMSDNVRKALLTAIEKAGPTRQIEDSHLLFGVLSTDSNARVQELNKRGMAPDKVPLPIRTPEPMATPAVLRSAPTPKIVSDLWSEEDLLGYGAYARTLAGVIAHKETVPPLSIGIKAPWGAGKTSLMKQLQRILDGGAKVTESNESDEINKTTSPLSLTVSRLWKELRGEIKIEPLKAEPSELGELYDISPRITVWFNAWKYQTSEQIWAGLAHCIISQVTARMSPEQRELFWLKLYTRRVNKEAVRGKIYRLLLRYLVPVAVAGIVLSIVFAWAVSPFSQAIIPILGVKVWWTKTVLPLLTLAGVLWGYRHMVGEKAADVFKDFVREPDYEGKMGFLHLVESDIREVLNLVATKQSPLVIFVDDLDRCVPRKVAEVVEAINLSLCGDYPNCIFVLGMESGMVAAALEVANKEVIEKAKQLSLLDTTIPLGWRFMEKIVQLPISIPPPTETGLKGYATSLTGSVESLEEMQEQQVAEKSSLPAKEKIEEYKAKLERLRSAGDVADVTKQMMEQAPQEERLAVAEASKQKYAEKLVARDPLVKKFVEDVFVLVGGNPRQIKRYINVFRFHSTLRFNFEKDLEARGLKAKSASDGGLAKFIAMAIQWPQAPEFLRKVYPVPADGKAVPESMLKALEKKSQSLKDQRENADIEWADFLKNAGLGNVEWMATQTFRKFLAEGETLSELEECGLW